MRHDPTGCDVGIGLRRVLLVVRVELGGGFLEAWLLGIALWRSLAVDSRKWKENLSLQPKIVFRASHPARIRTVRTAACRTLNPRLSYSPMAALLLA